MSCRVLLISAVDVPSTTTTSASSSSKAAASYASLGCYSDTPVAGDLSATGTPGGDNLTTAECCAACQQAGYPYAGLQLQTAAAAAAAATSCYCATEFGTQGQSDGKYNNYCGFRRSVFCRPRPNGVVFASQRCCDGARDGLFGVMVMETPVSG